MPLTGHIQVLLCLEEAENSGFKNFGESFFKSVITEVRAFQDPLFYIVENTQKALITFRFHISCKWVDIFLK